VKFVLQAAESMLRRTKQENKKKQEELKTQEIVHHKCNGTTKIGEMCKNNAKQGFLYCHFHLQYR